MKSVTLTAALAAAAVIAAGLAPAHAQWTHRYPKVEGFGHHVYLEGYELPILTSGGMDPAPAHDGRRLAYADHGFLWSLDLLTGEATQLTDAAGADSRPAWSPDDAQLAFIRDTGSDTLIVIRDMRNGETREIDTAAIDLDPAFSADGAALYFASAQAGGIDIWRFDLATEEMTRVTQHEGVERRPRLSADGARLYYLASPKSSERRLIERDLATGEERILARTSIAGQAGFDLHPNGRTIAMTWPQETGWRIVTLDARDPAPQYFVTEGGKMPLAPAWSADGASLFFAESGEDQQFSLYQVPAMGGAAPLAVAPAGPRWENAGSLSIQTKIAGRRGRVPTRLSVTRADGHAMPSPAGPSYFDSQNGVAYFYSDGEAELDLPPGEYVVRAARGLMAPAVAARARVAPLGAARVDMELDDVWDAAADGFVSGDHHFHLNYDGPHRLGLEMLDKLMEGENLDVGAPLSANLHNRLQDPDIHGDRRGRRNGPHIWQGQEVRSHFHGHIGIIGADDLYTPWFWGPGYPDLGLSNQTNASVLAFARSQGAFASYVHPVIGDDPFAGEDVGRIPLELVSDAVLGDLDGLEIVCAWSDEIGTASLWHRLLNIGAPIAPSAGTDMFADFHRTPALGAARIYVDGVGRFDWDRYLAGVKAGRSFVTNGPALLFTLGGARPGGVVAAGGRVEWTLDLASAAAVERVEIYVNGEIAWSADGLEAAGATRYGGALTLPSGGWVAARAVGGEIAWPLMDSYPFAQTAPVWIGAVGSAEPAAASRAAADLLRALDAAEARAREAYGDADNSAILARFAAARAKLEALL